MSLSPVRRAVVAAAIGACAAVGVVAVPSAVGDAHADTCRQTSTQSKKEASTAWLTHSYEKSVTAQASAGHSVTYTIKVASEGLPFVNAISDHAPAGFGKPTVKVTAWHAIGGMRAESVPVHANGADTWKVSSDGWAVSPGKTLIAEYTYRVPSNLSIGHTVTSGGVGVAGTVGVSREMPGLTSRFTVRAPNPGEIAGGSLEDSGFGSSDGGLFDSGSVQDGTSGVIGGIIDGIGGS